MKYIHDQEIIHDKKIDNEENYNLKISIPLRKNSQYKESTPLNSEEFDHINIDNILNDTSFLRRLPERRKIKSRWANYKYRVNGKFVSKERALSLLNISINLISENKTIQDIANKSLGYAISAFYKGLTFYNFDHLILESIENQGFPPINLKSPLKIEVMKIDNKRHNILISINEDILSRESNVRESTNLKDHKNSLSKSKDKERICSFFHST